MLKELKKYIDLYEGLVAVSTRRIKEAKSSQEEAYWVGVGKISADIVKDLKKLQEKAEHDLQSVDTDLSALRGE